MVQEVTPTDEMLMQAFAAGDARAFETLYERLALGVWRYVLRSVQDRAVTDELVQDVWFTVARHAPKYQPRARFRTWLFTLAHHRMVDHFRTRHPHDSLDAQHGAGDEGASLADTLAADSGFGPVRQLQTRERAQALLDALAGLPAGQREAFLLQAEGGLSVAEIARTTGVSTETARSRLRYARARLRQTLEGCP